MQPAPRLLFVADVGGPATYHVGDEAMLLANLDGFRERLTGLEATIVSRDPAWTARHTEAKSVLPFGFPEAGRASDDDRQSMLDRLLADAEQGRVCSEAMQAIADCDGVVISGGGNLSSTWPEHVFERVAFGALARRLGKPVVLLGQTIGPDVSPRIRPLVSDLLRNATFVGVRELPSAALARALGTPADRLFYQTDDAVFLNPVRVEEEWAAELTGGAPWIAITLDPFGQGRAVEGVLAALADQLARLAAFTGARLAFIPHVAGCDAGVGRALAARLPSATPLFVCPDLDARRAYWLTAQASLIVGTRYHPLVFGLAAARPCVGLVTDEYRRTKLHGALAHADLSGCCLSMEQAVGGGLFEAASQQWARREVIGQELVLTRERWRIAEQNRWHRVIAALGVEAVEGMPDAAAAALGRDPSELVPLLLSELESRGAFAAELSRFEAARYGELERYAVSLEAERGALHEATRESERFAVSLLEEVDRLRATCDESERYAMSLREELERLRASCAESECYALSLLQELSKVQTAYEAQLRRNPAA